MPPPLGVDSLLMLLIFPIAAFTTLVSFHLLVSYLQTSSPSDPIVKWSIDNWIVILLIGIILSSTICIVDYFFSTKSFDKLKTQYAIQAIISAKEVRAKIESFPLDTREENRIDLIKKARETKKIFNS